MANFGRKLIFFCASGPSTPAMLLQYNCKHDSVGLSQTPAVLNHKVHNEYQKKHCFRHKIDNVLGENCFFLCWRPCNPRYVAAIQLQTRFSGSVPAPAVVNQKALNQYQKKHCFRGEKWAIHRHLWAKTDFFLCWRPCNPRYASPIQLQTRFSGSVPDPGGLQSSYKMFVHSNPRNHQW